MIHRFFGNSCQRGSSPIDSCFFLLKITTMLLLFVLTSSDSRAQLRVVTYNTLTGQATGQQTARAESEVVLEAIGEEVVNGIAKPIDVLLLQEQYSMQVSAQSFVDLLNDIYGPGTYARSSLNSATTAFNGEGGGPGLVYNTTTVEFLGEQRFGNVNSSAQPRSSFRYHLRPVGYDSSADFYAYNNHYKASTGSTNEQRRLKEAEGVRNNSDALGEGVHAIYAGDYNVQTPNEDGIQELLSAGPGQAVDPINLMGVAIWTNNPGIAEFHSQSTCQFGCGSFSSGGVDDRFDMQLVTSEFMDDEGLSFVSGSYRTFGNNGSTLNQAIDGPSNDIVFNFGATPTYTGAEVLEALRGNSDHLPVVVDYQIPARMSVAVQEAPRVLRGASVPLSATISNSAPVVASVGADELDYSLSTSGDITGNASGSILALAAGDTIDLGLDTSVAGSFSGEVNVSTSSQGAANSSFNQLLDVDVLDHAVASFDEQSLVTELTLDFGTLAVGASPLQLPFEIVNQEQTLGFTSALDLDLIEIAGDVPSLETDLSVFFNLAAGTSTGELLATFTPNSVGQVSESYTLTFSDEDLPGSSIQTLTLQLVGEAIDGPLRGDFNGDSRVDLADYTVWRDNLGAADESLINNAGMDNGAIDVGDYEEWKINFGDSLGAGLTSGPVGIPEPGSLGLFALIGIVCAGYKRFAA